jgi:hypothetical protein
VSALAVELGDRYRLRDDEWQVVAFETGFKAAGPRSDHRARLARVDGGRGAKRAKLEDLLVGSWVYLGNFLPPPGFKVTKVGAHWYFKTPAGNVHGAPAGIRWTEADVLREARAAATGGSAAACSPA